MAPEQHDCRKVDARADQFALCVALYEGLYGERPFAGDTYSELALAVSNGELRPPPAGTKVPNWVRNIVTRGLATEPDERYPSMEALLRDLEVDPEAIRRTSRRMLAIGVAFVALAGVAIFGLVQSRRTGETKCKAVRAKLGGVWDEDRSAAVERAFLRTGQPNAAHVYERVANHLDDYAGRWVAARTAACEATHVHGEQSEAILDSRMRCLDRRLGEAAALIDLFANEPDSAVLDKATEAASKLGGIETCANVETLAAVVPMPGDPEVGARVVALRARLDRAKALRDAGKIEAGLKIASAAVQEAKKTHHAPIEAETLFLLATFQIRTGDSLAAERNLKEAIVKAASARDDLISAYIWLKLLWVVGQQQARHEEALGLRPFVEAAVLRVGAGDSLRAELASYLGAVLHKKGDFDEARELYERSLAIREKTLGPDHPGVAFSLNNLGALLSRQGKHDEASEFLERALAIREKELGPDHTLVATSLYNLGNVLQRRGKYDEARRCYQRSLAINERALGADHLSVALVHGSLGVMLAQQGLYEEGRSYLERALGIKERSLPGDHPSVAHALDNLAKILRHQGKHDEARALYERSVEICEANAVPPRDLARARFSLAKELWASKRDRARAIDLTQKARDAYAAAGKGSEKELSEVETWLWEHGAR